MIKKKLYPPSSTLSDHLKGLVGIEKRIEDVKSLLTSAPIVGIWGMGGLGKTTLAKAVFKQCRSQFKGHCFLANVREEMQKKGETELKKLLFDELSNEKDLDESVKTNFLYRKKLLIVLDDVDESDQFDRLIGDWDWLNLETSRVIITSRDREVLRNIIKGDSDKVIYNLMELRQEDALKLFRLHAFKGNSAEEISYEEMSIKFVNYSGGVPLALKVLGSHLFEKSKEVWDSAWNKLSVVPNEKIQGALEISFAGLDSKQKEIFLDIACFFKGWSKDSVKKILDEGGCFEDVITTLVDKSLITLSYDHDLEMHDHVLEMHDLLKEMGWKIVRGPFPKEVGKYSRLWIADDIFRVLIYNTGTATIEGIFLNFFIKHPYINLKPDVFTKMSSLRLLRIMGPEFHLPRGGLDSFPDTLRYLYWEDYPLESLGTPRDLVYLEMKSSQLEKLWNEDQHYLRNLKYINLNYSEKLTCLPDLSQANLRILSLVGCKSLVELPPLKFQDVAHKLTEKETNELYSYVRRASGGELYSSVGSRLFLEGISSSDIYPLENWLIEYSTNIQILNLESCSNLKTLSEMSRSINFISLRKTKIEELHPSIGSLTNLVFLNLAYCEGLKNLPRSICDLGSLEYLDMSGCSSIDKFPELPKSIRGLDLSGTSIEHVPSSSFEWLPCLEILDMTLCERLVSLPTSICKLQSLRKLSLSDCSQFKSFPEIVEPMENLKQLDLSRTGIKDIPSSIENLVMLDALDMRGCKNLESIPTSICKLKSLKTLKLSNCSELKTFPEILEPMENLEELDLSGTGIKDVPSSIMNLVILET